VGSRCPDLPGERGRQKGHYGTAAEKLGEVRRALPDITENDDRQVVQRLDLALEQLGDRAGDWRKKLSHRKRRTTPNKVVPLKAIADD
jgi:hypothetical protein